MTPESIKEKLERLLSREGVREWYLGPAAWAPKGRLVAYERYSQILPTQGLKEHVIDAAHVTRLENLLKEVSGLCEALENILKSKVLQEAPFYSYSEAIANGQESLTQAAEVLEGKV